MKPWQANEKGDFGRPLLHPADNACSIHFNSRVAFPQKSGPAL